MTMVHCHCPTEINETGETAEVSSKHRSKRREDPSMSQELHESAKHDQATRGQSEYNLKETP